MSENIHLLLYTSVYQIIKGCMFAFSLRPNIHQRHFFFRNLPSALLALILFQCYLHIGNILFLPMKHFISPEETKCFHDVCCYETDI